MLKVNIVKFFIVILAVVAVLFSPTAAYAAKPDEVPEVSGDYPDPEHKNVRVRVFVHGFKDKDRVETSVLNACTDPDSNSHVGATGWKLPSGVWNYNLNPSSVPGSVGPANLESIAGNGFNDFASALSSSSARPIPTRGANTSKVKSAYDGLNIIAWGQTSGQTLGVTYTRYFTSSGLVVDVDTILNRRLSWSWSGNTSSCGSPNSYDAENILTHEIGHWFGLNDHYDAPYFDNTMFGYGSKNEIKKDTLTSGDINGVKAIYP